MRLLTPALTAMLVLPLPAIADTFVLVHGAFQDGSSWSAVTEALKAAGHTAVAVTLPGRGDGRALGEVTMVDHVAAVTAAIDAVGAPVVLVGHSFGGMVISATAETAPDKISTLVYVAAYLPHDGQSMQDLAAVDHHNGFQSDTFQVAADYSSATINPRDGSAIFANDADSTLATEIAAALIPEPLQPIATPATLSARFDGVRKAYVVTLRDKAVSTDLQLTMLGRGSVDEAIPFDSGHSPQRTKPAELATALIRAATPELE